MLVLCPRMTLVWKISWKPNTCARSGAQRVGLARGAGRWRAAEPAGGVRCEPRTPRRAEAEPAEASVRPCPLFGRRGGAELLGFLST